MENGAAYSITLDAQTARYVRVNVAATNSTASAPPVMPKALNRNFANLHFIVALLLYQPMLSSKSTSDGSTGSSCRTLVMYSLTALRASRGETMR